MRGLFEHLEWPKINQSVLLQSVNGQSALFLVALLMGRLAANWLLIAVLTRPINRRQGVPLP